MTTEAKTGQGRKVRKDANVTIFITPSGLSHERIDIVRPDGAKIRIVIEPRSGLTPPDSSGKTQG